MKPEPCTNLGCPLCNTARERERTPQRIGQPCDICGGTGIDYLGRTCRCRETT